MMKTTAPIQHPEHTERSAAAARAATQVHARAATQVHARAETSAALHSEPSAAPGSEPSAAPNARRSFLKTGLSAAGIFALASPIAVKKALAATCGLTPPQTPGPFYPGEANFSSDIDLTRVPGKPGRAKGQVIYVRGTVLDQHCKPIEGANVELWQACASGKYNSPKDPNPAPLDPHFRYWAETYTDAKGEYVFKTIIPGEYPADTGWTRPPHLHFKITKLGHKELVTQMYFAGNPLNEADLILQDLSKPERENVIVDFEPSPVGMEPGSLTGSFDITLRRIR